VLRFFGEAEGEFHLLWGESIVLEALLRFFSGAEGRTQFVGGTLRFFGGKRGEDSVGKYSRGLTSLC
jgi:hypothetical protein